MKISKICKRYFTFMVLKLQKLPVRKISKRVFSAIQSKPVHVTAVLSLFLVTAGIIFLRSNLQNVFSATYGWVQSD
jgi:predicted transporter